MRNLSHRSILTVVCTAALAFALAACGPSVSMRKSRRTQVAPVSTETLEGTRQALEGSWTLVSLEVVNPQGSRTPVKATGQLKYDAFGTMTIRGVVDDPALRDKLTLNYDGRIVLDTTRHEFRPMDLVSDRPVEPSQIVPVSPDKIRRYELVLDSFVVTYLDASSQPTAVASWRRAAR